METVKRYIRRMSFAVRFGSDDVSRDISMISRDMQLITSEDRDDAIQYVRGRIDVIHYISQMPGHNKVRLKAEPFLEDLTVFKVSQMVLGEDTVKMLNCVDRILVAAVDDIWAPTPRYLPEFVDVSAIRVYSVEVVSTDGVICARLYDARKEILAMIDIGASASMIVFYPEGGAKTLTVKGDRHMVVFVRI